MCMNNITKNRLIQVGKNNEKLILICSERNMMKLD